MSNILLFGAGKSASCLIKYLIDFADLDNNQLHIVDMQTSHLQNRFPNNAFLQLHNLNLLENETERIELIENADIVLSLLPPSLHIIIAKDCLLKEKNLITASYVSPEMEALHQNVLDKNLLFMCEMGLDPGIDHMSAMEIIKRIELQGGKITSFKSHCGGLVAPESDTNPWHYKISWNPRNIVTAGQAGATFLQDGFEKKLNYENIFENCDNIQLPPLGELAFYPNRDSMHYIKLYDLKNATTLMRTTLRYPIFTKAWDVIIAMGLTEEKDIVDSDNLSFKKWISNKMKISESEVDSTISNYCKNEKELIHAIQYLNLNSNEIIKKGNCSSADILQSVIEAKWKLETTDKDMIAMQHEFNYEINGEKKYLSSSLVVKGEDNVYTAMAKTVGLPMGILARLLLQNKIKNIYGLQIPILSEVYEPVLQELKVNGIIFEEREY
jgi:saccharopine dehydrogenase-like NADP-dependent oxidoreductase